MSLNSTFSSDVYNVGIGCLCTGIIYSFVKVVNVHTGDGGSIGRYSIQCFVMITCKHVFYFHMRII